MTRALCALPRFLSVQTSRGGKQTSQLVQTDSRRLLSPCYFNSYFFRDKATQKPEEQQRQHQPGLHCCPGATWPNLPQLASPTPERPPSTHSWALLLLQINISSCPLKSPPLPTLCRLNSTLSHCFSARKWVTTIVSAMLFFPGTRPVVIKYVCMRRREGFPSLSNPSGTNMQCYKVCSCTAEPRTDFIALIARQQHLWAGISLVVIVVLVPQYVVQCLIPPVSSLKGRAARAKG